MIATHEQVMKTLADVVAENPEKVYAAPEHMKSVDRDYPLHNLSCFYVHTDEGGTNPKPGCLVGAVLHRLGVSLEYLSKNEGRGAAVMTGELGLPDETRSVLDHVQGRQDDGATWEQALRSATTDDGAVL